MSDLHLEIERPNALNSPLSGGSIDLEHTAMSSFSVTTGADSRFEDAADVLSPARFYYGNTLLMRGILLRSERSQERNETRLEGRGRGWFLSRGEASVQYENVYAADAIADYWGKTRFSATVTKPGPQPSATDLELRDAPTDDNFADILTIPDTAPFKVQNSTLQVCQTAWLREAEGINEIYPDEYSDGIGVELAGSNQSPADLNFTTEYDIPRSNFTPVARGEEISSGGVVDVYLDGSRVNSVPTDTTLGWETSTANNVPDPIPAGSHTLSLEYDEVNSPAQDNIDIFGVVDDRFSYTFDNSVTPSPANQGSNEDGYLDGPEEYPAGTTLDAAVLFDEVLAPETIAEANIDVAVQDGETLPGMAATFDGGNSFKTASNTNSASFSAGTPTTTVETRLTFGRYGGPRDTATPRTGYKGHVVDDYRLSVDTDARGIIEKQAFTDDHLTNLQNLHEVANMRFVIDHTDPDLKARSFPIGQASPSSVEWRTVNATRDLDLTDYANRVVLRGAAKPQAERTGVNDLRYSASAEDEAEITRLMNLGLTRDEATFTVTQIEPRLDTPTAVRGQVASVLQDRVSERELTGTLDIQPTLVFPGYRYEIDAFGGDKMDLQRVRFDAGRGLGSLQFRDDQNLVPSLSSISREVGGIKQSL